MLGYFHIFVRWSGRTKVIATLPFKSQYLHPKKKKHGYQTRFFWKMQLLWTMAVNLIRFQILSACFVPQFAPQKKNSPDPALRLGSSVNPNDPWIIQGIEPSHKGSKNSAIPNGYNEYKGLSIKKIMILVGIRKNHRQLQENSYFCNWFFDWKPGIPGHFWGFASSTIPRKTIPFNALVDVKIRDNQTNKNPLPLGGTYDMAANFGRAPIHLRFEGNHVALSWKKLAIEKNSPDARCFGCVFFSFCFSNIPRWQFTKRSLFDSLRKKVFGWWKPISLNGRLGFPGFKKKATTNFSLQPTIDTIRAFFRCNHQQHRQRKNKTANKRIFVNKKAFKSSWYFLATCVDE